MAELDTKIHELVLNAAMRRVCPGGVVGYIRDNTVQVLPFGHVTYRPDSPPVTKDTLYDLASVTKSIPTASIILSLADKGVLSLDDKVTTYIPELTTPGRDEILIRHLMSFSVVFDLAQPLSSYVGKGSEELFHLLFTTPLRYPPGQRFLYADIPYLLLGVIIERVTRKSLDEVASAMFFTPLRMDHTTFRTETLAAMQIAPTEINDRGEVVGKVHDEKAWMLHQRGQMAGHAGLFSTAGDLLHFGQMLLNGGTHNGRRYFDPSTIALMYTEAAGDEQLGVSLGWNTRAAFMGPNLPSDTFGKGGFTGTLVLLSPLKQRCLVLLTNRTYPTRSESPTIVVHELRRTLTDLVFS